MLNRTIAPKLQVIDSIDFVAPRKYTLANGIKLYHMKDVPNETARFDLYFDAGKFRGKKGIPSSEWRFHQDIYVNQRRN